MPNYLKKMLPSAIILALDVFIFLAIPAQVRELTHEDVTTRFMPRLVCILIAACAVIDLIQIFLKEGKSRETGKTYFDKTGVLRVALGVLACVVYLMVLKLLGFVVSSILLTAAAMFLMGNRSVLQIVVTSVVLSLAVYCIFKLGLNMRLPIGLFFF